MRIYTVTATVLLGSAFLFLPGWVTAENNIERGEESVSESVSEAVSELTTEPASEEMPDVNDDQDISDEQEVWTVAVISDLNGSYGSTEYTSDVHGAVDWIAQTLRPDLVVSAGDMVAGQRQGLDYRGMWKNFHEAVTDELAGVGVPLAVTPGNHDASGSPAFWEERVHFAREWRGRRPDISFVDDSFYPFRYAFEVGPALFISLDGTQVGPLDDAQLSWVEDVLKGSSHEVKVVFSHLPLYAVAAQGRETEILKDERLEDLFIRYEVDMMIAGHHHAYYPGKRADTIYLHAACLGTGQRMLMGEDSVRAKNVAVVQFDASGIVGVEAVESPEFERVVDHELLPRSIGEGEAKIWRMDVDPDVDMAVEDPES